MATVTYQCPGCGGGLLFDPAIQKYGCEYCLSEYTQEQLERMAPKQASDQGTEPGTKAAGQEELQALLYTCPSCGAEVVTDETTAAAFCFYCHNPVVLTGKLEGQYQPDFVLPFALDKEKATGIFTQWISRKKMVPNAFFTRDQIEKITGVYFPYWLYSCQVDGKLDAEGIKLRTWVMGNMQYTETQKYDLSRAGTMEVSHVTRNALKKADKRLVEGVLPFEMKELKPFSMGYLSGFLAEKRDMNKQEFTSEIEAEIKSFAASNLQSEISGYHSVSVKSNYAHIVNPMWKYALMPVWTLTYRDKNNKIFYFACNGQTGKVCGELPVDKGKLAWVFAGVFLPLLAALLVMGYFI